MLDYNDKNFSYLLNSLLSKISHGFLGLSSDCTEEQENNLKDKDRTLKKSDCKEVPLVKVKKTNPNLETEKLSEVSHFDIKMNIGGQ